MAAYPVTDLRATARAASAQLGTLAGRAAPAGEAERRDLREVLAMRGVVLGDALADLGRLGEATRALDAAEQHASAVGHRGLLAWVAGTRALGHIQLGDPHTALDTIGMALPAATDSPARSRLYAVAAEAYALRGGGTEAAAALWLARTTAEKHAGGDDVYGVPFQTLSRAEVACAAASTYVTFSHNVLRDNRRAAGLAETWTPVVDDAGHTTLRIRFRGAHAAALARSEPDEAARLVAALLDMTSELGELGAGTHRTIALFFERATDTATVRDLAARYRTLRTPRPPEPS